MTYYFVVYLLTLLVIGMSVFVWISYLLESSTPHKHTHTH
jgi:hypothetical protein